MSDEIERKRAAREQLVRSAKHALRVVGLSRYEWETEPEIIAYAKKNGLTESDIDHISAWAGGL